MWGFFCFIHQRTRRPTLLFMMEPTALSQVPHTDAPPSTSGSFQTYLTVVRETGILKRLKMRPSFVDASVQDALNLFPALDEVRVTDCGMRKTRMLTATVGSANPRCESRYDEAPQSCSSPTGSAQCATPAAVCASCHGARGRDGLCPLLLRHGARYGNLQGGL